MFDLNLTAPIGRRMRGLLLVVVAVIVVAQVTMYAQSSQRDCVGDYENAMSTYYNQMMQQVADARNNYYWFDPRRIAAINFAGIEYYARGESAMGQLIGCSTSLLAGG